MKYKVFLIGLHFYYNDRESYVTKSPQKIQKSPPPLHLKQKWSHGFPPQKCLRESLVKFGKSFLEIIHP
jgi:hypothetical protein